MLRRVSEYDPRVGMQLKLCHAFFLRVQEAVMLKPNTAERGEGLVVRDGTKGGRERLVPIQTDYQRRVLDEAKRMAWTNRKGYLSHPDLTLEQALEKVTTVCTRFGLTRKGLGVTTHGLRHEGLNDLFEGITGVPSPVRNAGGAKAVVQKVHKDVLAYARQSVAEAAGHARISISGAYIGGLIGPRKRLSPGEERLSKDWMRFFELNSMDGLGFLEKTELEMLRKKLNQTLESDAQDSV
ncbi:MAG: hypothetical protein C0607_09950 [Azoarcus sp.]|nr:MAG: hypothetical protein C0607_09950 [Azoarcus sp.]